MRVAFFRLCSWSTILQQQEEADRVAKAAADANVGRGKRKRAQVHICLSGSVAASTLTCFTRTQIAYKTDSPGKGAFKKRKDALSSVGSGDSSDDEFVNSKIATDEDSDEDFMPLDRDDRLEDVDRAPGLPALARPDKPVSGVLPRPEKVSKARKKDSINAAPFGGLAPDIRATSGEEARMIKRRKQIDALARAAARFHEPELDSLLAQARTASRLEQTELLKEATTLITRLGRAIQGGPLAAKSAIVDAVGRSSNPVFGSKEADINGKGKQKGAATKKKKKSAVKPMGNGARETEVMAIDSD